MPILRDIPVELTAQDIVPSARGKQIRPELLIDADKSIALGQSLWQPIAIYDRFQVQAVEGEQVRLAPLERQDGGTSLHIGPKSDLLLEAKEVLIGIGTIGPALEERVHELQGTKEALHSYLLDSAGVVALGAVGEALRRLAEEMAAEQGWGVSAALSPGSLVGWPLHGQRELCALLDLDQIGVWLNKHYVLEPHKSFSTVIGLGPGYTSVRVGSVCKYCALKDTCWRRREESS